MNNNINQILEKYWKAETDLHEEAELSKYFASEDVSDNHKEYASLFYYISNQKLVQSNQNVSEIINTINDVDVLINRYLDAESTIADEKILKAYFSSEDIAPAHLEFKPLFDFYKTAGNMTTDMEFNGDAVVDNNIDSLITKYLNVETSLEEENVLNTYFQSGEVEDAHLEYKPLFAFYDQAAGMTTDIDISSFLVEGTNDIDVLLEKYWNAETKLEEEETLHTYFASNGVLEKHLATKDLFYFYANQRSANSNIDIRQLFEKEASNGGTATDNTVKPQANEAKVFTLRKMATAIAAIFVLGFAAVTVMNQSSAEETQYRGKYVQLDEEAEAQEAYEITKQAFALLSKNMNRGSKTVKKSVKKAENASIFKTKD